MKATYIFFSFALFMSCNSKKGVFQKLESSTTHIDFANNITVTDSLNALKFEYIYNGAGVGIGDFNNDGHSDVFFAGNQVSSKLYLNEGKGEIAFKDVSEEAKIKTSSWCTGVSVVDINQDGLLDVFVSNISPKINTQVPKIFFINQGINSDGIPVFKESAADLGLADLSYGTQASFFDFDLDGDLDVYMLTNAMENFNRNNSMGQRTKGEGKSIDKLYRNEGNSSNTNLPKFTDISKEAGILTEGWGLGIIINDVNNDGYPDVYVGNDFLSNDHLYINNKNGTFTNSIADYMQHQSMNSMGLDMADINNDGFNDLVVVDMLPDDNLRQKTMFSNVDYDKYQENLRKNYQPQFVRNVLQLNNGNNTFSDISYFAGMAATDWSWSPLISDFDNDGLRDILITNGYRLDVTDLDFISYRGDNDVFSTKDTKAKKMKEAFAALKGVKKPNFFFRNNGDLKFENQSEAFGLDTPSYTNGTAYADFDNDGDLDLVMNNIDDKAFIYKNNTPAKNWLRISLVNKNNINNGFGAKITIYSGKNKFYAEHQTVRGYKSTVENIEHIGLGNQINIDSLMVIWPGGASQKILNLKSNQVLKVFEKNASKQELNVEENNMLFEEVSEKYGLNFTSPEENYNDFIVQHTLPHKHSELGPAMAVGDINGDKLEDLFIGGSSHKEGVFFIQNKNSTFTKKPFLVKDEEDTAVALLDFDKDGDLDLYCVSGGTEYKTNFIKYRDRIYVNNGKGDFSFSQFLPTQSSGGAISPCDFDKDGDIDVLRSGRVIPTQYPMTPETYLFKNDGKGNFTNQISQIARGMNQVGMVSSAIWTDFNNDSWPDLMFVGEFMPVTIYVNEKGKRLTKLASTDLEKTNGWWNTISPADIDKDGDLDYILGNLGLNSRLKASISEPVSMHAKDFDNDGIMDPLLTTYNTHKEYLVHPRGTLIDQLIAMRRRFKTYKEYGETVFEDAIPAVDLKGAKILKAYNFANSYLENKGKNSFKLSNLPTMSQLSPLKAAICQDFNGDGHQDILSVGNDYSTEVLTGRYDAGIGNYMQGDGKGNFTNIKNSGFFVRGDARAMVQITQKNGQKLIVVSQHKGKILAFKRK